MLDGGPVALQASVLYWFPSGRAMVRQRVFISAVALLGACATQQTDADPALASAENGEEVVCKRTGVVEGRIARRVCLTRAEWEQKEDAERSAARDALGGLTGRSETGAPAGGPG
jgi:hypothetical protein